MSRVDDALLLRDTIQKIIDEKIKKERPGSSYATVTGFDPVAGTVSVRYEGDDIDVDIPAGSIYPSEPGQVVRVGGNGGTKVIEDVIGENLTEVKVRDAQETADGKNTVHYGDAMPEGSDYKEGDIWFDEGNSNMPNIWKDGEWVTIEDLRVSAIAEAQGELRQDLDYVMENGTGTKTFYKPTMPAVADSKEGDLWFDTSPDGGNELHTFVGGSWVSTADARIAAIQAAQESLREDLDDVIENGAGTSTHYSPTMPPASASKEGDLWFDPSDKNKPYIYHDGEWITVAQSFADKTGVGEEIFGFGFGNIRPEILNGQVTTVPDFKFGLEGWINRAIVGSGDGSGTAHLIVPLLGSMEVDGTAVSAGEPYSAKQSLGFDLGLDEDGGMTVQSVGGVPKITLHWLITLGAESAPLEFPLVVEQISGNLYRARLPDMGSLGALYGTLGDAISFALEAKLPDLTGNYVNLNGIRAFTQIQAAGIADKAITTPKIAVGAITAESGVVGSLDAGKIIVGTLAAARLAASSITADKIAVGAITTEKIATGAITAESGIIASLDAGKITVGTLAAARFAANTINADSILVNGSLGSTIIKDGAITTAKIAVGAITAESGVIGSLDASKITVGTLSGARLAADAIDGKQIIGATIATSTSFPRVQLDAAGLAVYKSSAVRSFFADATTGNLSIVASLYSGTAGASRVAIDPTLWTGLPVYGSRGARIGTASGAGVRIGTDASSLDVYHAMYDRTFSGRVYHTESGVMTGPGGLATVALGSESIPHGKPEAKTNGLFMARTEGEDYTTASFYKNYITLDNQVEIRTEYSSPITGTMFGSSTISMTNASTLIRSDTPWDDASPGDFSRMSVNQGNVQISSSDKPAGGGSGRFSHFSVGGKSGFQLYSTTADNVYQGYIKQTSPETTAGYMDIFSQNSLVLSSNHVNPVIIDAKAGQASWTIPFRKGGVSWGYIGSTGTMSTDDFGIQSGTGKGLVLAAGTGSAKLTLATDGTITGLPMAGGRGSTGTMVANTPKSVAVTFPTGRFSSVPNVSLTISSTVPGTTVLGCGVSSVTAKGFTAYLTRTNTTSTAFEWTAILQD